MDWEYAPHTRHTRTMALGSVAVMTHGQAYVVRERVLCRMGQ